MAFIPVKFFWDISVRFLSWECWVFWRRQDHFRRFPKKSEFFRRRPKTAGVCRTLCTLPLDLPLDIQVVYGFYTCQIFLRYKREIFILGVLGFLKTTGSFPKIPEEVRILPKTSEDCRSLPHPLHPPPRSAPGLVSKFSCLSLSF